MIVIGVVDKPPSGERRNQDQGNPRPVSEKPEGLDIARVVITSPFVEGDENGRILIKFGVAPDESDGFLKETLELREG